MAKWKHNGTITQTYMDQNYALLPFGNWSRGEGRDPLPIPNHIPSNLITTKILIIKGNNTNKHKKHS
jgi:hypothetical protein